MVNAGLEGLKFISPEELAHLRFKGSRKRTIGHSYKDKRTTRSLEKSVVKNKEAPSK